MPTTERLPLPDGGPRVRPSRTDGSPPTTPTSSGRRICAFANDFPRQRAARLPARRRPGRRRARRIGSHGPDSAAAGRSAVERQSRTIARDDRPEACPPGRRCRRRRSASLGLAPRPVQGTRLDPRRPLEARRPIGRKSASSASGGLPHCDRSTRAPARTLPWTIWRPGCSSNGYLPAAVAPEILAENDRGLREQLASLRFHDHRTDTPTNAAVLLFGNDPLRWLPGAWIQFVRWAGRDHGRGHSRGEAVQRRPDHRPCANSTRSFPPCGTPVPFPTPPSGNGTTRTSRSSPFASCC